MTLDDIERSIRDAAAPPPGLAAPLAAPWRERRGDGARAHAIARDDEAAPASAWVHAPLHRREGDVANARYRYRRAGRPAAAGELDAEWRAIAAPLLAA